MLKKSNGLLVRYCQWLHVEKRDRRVIDGEKHNINAGNLKDCSNITISDDAADGFIATAIDAENLADCAGNAAGVLIDSINYGELAGLSDIFISFNAADKFIAAYAVNSRDCVDTIFLIILVMDLWFLWVDRSCATDVMVNYVMILECMAVRKMYVLIFECVVSWNKNSKYPKLSTYTPCRHQYIIFLTEDMSSTKY